MTKERLGEFIALQRKNQGMTQRELAEKLHVTDKAVSKWERGLSYPDVTLLEPLAEILGLEVGELLACQERKEEESVQVLMDISKENLRRERLRGSRRLVGVLVLAVLTALLALYVTMIGRVNHERNTVFWTETIEGENYVYLEKEAHLLRLKCKESDIETIKADEKYPYFGKRLYYMDYTWNKQTYEGTLHACEGSDLIALGGMEDAMFAPDSVSIFHHRYVSSAPENYYKNPYGDGYLCDYRFWIENMDDPLLLITDCLNATIGDIDGDTENEIIVRTYYIEKPYIIYDDTTGTIEPTYVEDIPEEFKEQLVCIWER